MTKAKMKTKVNKAMKVEGIVDVLTRAVKIFVFVFLTPFVGDIFFELEPDALQEAARAAGSASIGILVNAALAWAKPAI